MKKSETGFRYEYRNVSFTVTDSQEHLLPNDMDHITLQRGGGWHLSRHGSGFGLGPELDEVAVQSGRVESCFTVTGLRFVFRCI